MDSTERAAKDIWLMESMVEETQIPWRNIVPTKPDAQTVKKTIPYFQDLVEYTKERK